MYPLCTLKQGIEQEMRNVPTSSTNARGGVLQQAPRAAKGKREYTSEMIVLRFERLVGR